MPRISVIVPVYKVEKYLKRCVDSILNQTFTDFELILVDDGSPDNCPQICDEYAKKDERVKVIHKSNGGLSDARNAGIDWTFSNSDSEWISFIDSDDWIHHSYLEVLYNACIENDVNVALCNYVRTTGENTEIDENMLKPELWNPEEFWCEDQACATVACAKLYSKQEWGKIRFPVGKIHEDEYTTYKILFNCEKVAFIPAEMYYYYYNSEGITGSQWSIKRFDGIEGMRQQLDFFCKNKYKSAEHVLALFYLQYLSENMRHLINSEHSYLLSQYKDELSAKYKKYGKTLNCNFNNCYYVYYFLYPKRTKIHDYFTTLRKYIKEQGIKFVINRMIKKLWGD